MKGIGEEKCRLVLFSLVYAHGGFVAFGSVGVQLEAAFPPGFPGRAPVAGSLDHLLSSDRLGYGMPERGSLCVCLRGGHYGMGAEASPNILALILHRRGQT